MSQVSNSGIAMPISLVRFSSSLFSTGKVPTFLGVATFRIMSNRAHDVCLIPVLIQSVLHCLSVQCVCLIVLHPGLISQLERQIQRSSFHAYITVEDI